MLMQLYNESYLFEIDDSDFDRIAKYKWHLSTDGYVNANVNGKRTVLHRFLLNLCYGDGQTVDHKDGNTLNNRQSNLRLCSQHNNIRNSRCHNTNKTTYKGVAIKKGGFQVKISNDLTHHYIGFYQNVIHAAQAYDKYAMIYHGEFARLNFQEGHELYCKNFPKEYSLDFKSPHPSKSSIFKGVSLDKRCGTWKSMCNKIYLGSFANEIDAAIAYNKKATEIWGNKAKLNIIDEGTN